MKDIINNEMKYHNLKIMASSKNPERLIKSLKLLDKEIVNRNERITYITAIKNNEVEDDER